MTENEKVYVDWEIDSIIQQLENQAMEKAHARNRSRVERGEKPVAGLHLNTIDWIAIQIMAQFRKDATAARDQLADAVDISGKIEFKNAALQEENRELRSFLAQRATTDDYLSGPLAHPVVTEDGAPPKKARKPSLKRQLLDG